MTNAEIKTIVFKKITELGFKIYKIENVDGYFICDMGKDSVTHFRLKGKGMWKHWKFGLWLNNEYLTEESVNKTKEDRENGKIEWDDEPKVIQLFAQHDTWIDKFKPSRSALLFTLDGEQFNDFLNGNDKNIFDRSYTFDRMKNMLMMMVKHPFLCYDEYCGEYCGYTDKSFIWSYIKYESEETYKRFVEKVKIAFWKPYTSAKIALCKNNKCIGNIELYDFEKENKGWSTSYLYQVRITFTKNATDEEITKWLDRWWKRKHYGKIGYYNYVVELESFKQVGHEGYFTFVD